ncbi:PH domain-containing protein [Amycolatopsis anabasis]|uniref:PH domain-containing protein n=1 Tax=Amycolatopsis anabasis TaxID=1840409 RepID=UPI00131B25B0|nr:PH domain-containing protein [Amycolatopsis anabasis]
MDNSASWAPRPALVAVAWLSTAAAAGGAVLTALAGDRPGAVLFGVAAVVLAALAAHGTLLRPRLTADPHGIGVRTLSGRLLLPWPDVQVRLRTTRRLGRQAQTLELEAEEVLLVLGWLELGAEPRDVLDTLSTLRTGH